VFRFFFILHFLFCIFYFCLTLRLNAKRLEANLKPARAHEHALLTARLTR